VVLTKPIMDANRQLEADSPLLSQVTMVWRKLGEAAFTSNPEYNKFARDGLKEMYADRLEKHHQDAFYAAFALDPIHFQRNASGSWSTPCSLLSSDEQEAAQAVFTRLACGSEAVEIELAQEFAEYRLSSLSPSLAAFLPHLTARHEVKRVDKKTGEEKVVSKVLAPAEQKLLGAIWQQGTPLVGQSCSPHACCWACMRPHAHPSATGCCLAVPSQRLAIALLWHELKSWCSSEEISSRARSVATRSSCLTSWARLKSEEAAVQWCSRQQHPKDAVHLCIGSD
jgi:hypothetical protein